MKNGGWFTVSEKEVARCRYCDAPVYWRESKATGKRYPAAVSRGHDQHGFTHATRLWVQHNPHRCAPAPKATDSIVAQIKACHVDLADALAALCETGMEGDALRKVWDSLKALRLGKLRSALLEAYPAADVEEAFKIYEATSR